MPLRVAAKIVCVAAVLCACADPISPPTGPIHRYVVSSQQFAIDNHPAHVGFDLDGNGDVNNELAAALQTLESFDLGALDNAAALVDRGDIILLIKQQTAGPSDPDDSVSLTVARGVNPNPAPCADVQDPVCRRHLQGDGYFGVTALGDQLLARGCTPPYVVGNGDAPFAIGLYGTAIELSFLDGRVMVDASDGTRLAGRMGGWVRLADLERTFLPLVVHAINDRIAAECTPGVPDFCGCPAMPETGFRFWLDYFDTNPRDCRLTTSELRESSQPLLYGDGIVGDEPVMSFAFGFEAVPAGFAP